MNAEHLDQGRSEARIQRNARLGSWSASLLILFLIAACLYGLVLAAILWMCPDELPATVPASVHSFPHPFTP